MRSISLAFLLLAAAPQVLSAQQADAQLNDTQRLGQALFVQSCGVCHLKPQLTSVQFGPVLSRESTSGREDAMREVIANGTPRMPGFKHHFDQTQIAAIAAYLKTVPAPQAAAPAPARKRENPAEAD
jgi:mono/diheme cytochrome c family protein